MPGLLTGDRGSRPAPFVSKIFRPNGAGACLVTGQEAPLSAGRYRNRVNAAWPVMGTLWITGDVVADSPVPAARPASYGPCAESPAPRRTPRYALAAGVDRSAEIRRTV